jgi:hypothetical protein
LLPAIAFAQGTTGTVRGKVIDGATGEPLAAVNVVVFLTDGEATNMGAFTNAEGDYVIINVPPGRYNLRATMMGYKTTEVTELLVTVGVSTNQTFALETTVLDVGEVVTVTAERDIIQRDVTATQQSYTIEEMERMAVSTTSDILALQTNVTVVDDFMNDFSGYYDRGFEMVNMRGGRNAQVAFMIDGMQVTNLVFGGQAAQVSPFSLSEMVVMASGMSAEFGNAMSGVVNMITREGGSSYDANLEVTSSEFAGANGQDDARSMTRTNAYFGGPVPMVPKLTFFVSGSGAWQREATWIKDDIVYDFMANPLDPNWVPNPNIDYYQLPFDENGNYDYAEFMSGYDVDDGGSYAEYNPYYQRDTTPANRRIHGIDLWSGPMGAGFTGDWDGMLNMTYRITPSMKLNLSGQNNGRMAVPWTSSWRYAILWGLPDWFQNYHMWGSPYYDSGLDIQDFLADPWYVDPYQLRPGAADPGGVFPSRSYVTHNNQDNGEWVNDFSQYLDKPNEKNELFQNNYRGAFVFTHQLNQSTFYTGRGSYYKYHRTMRVHRWSTWVDGDLDASGWPRQANWVWRGLDSSNLPTPLRGWGVRTRIGTGQTTTTRHGR